MASSPVGLEGLAPAVKDHAPGIDEATAVDLQPAGLGIVGPEPSAIEPARAVEGLDMAAYVISLKHVEEATGSPAQPVQGVMSILGSKPGEEHLPLICLAVSIAIMKVEKLFPVGDIGPSIPIREYSTRDDKLIIVDRGFVRPPVLIRVLENKNAVTGILIHIQLGVGFATGDPEPAFSVEGDLSGLGEERVGSPEVHFESFRDLERGFFQFRVGWRDLLQAPLGTDWKTGSREEPGDEVAYGFHRRASNCSRMCFSCFVTKGSNCSGSPWAVTCSCFRSP